MGDFVDIETEKLLAVASDLGFLDDLWQQPQIEVDDARRSWPVIRRLLIDRDLLNAAHKVGHTVLFSAPNNLPTPSQLAEAGVTYSQHSIARIGPIETAGFSNGSVGHQLDPGFETPLLLKPASFLNQKVIYFHGDFVTRGEIIRYAANRMGGVHFGKRATKSFDLIDRIRGSVFFGFDGDRLTIKIQGSRILNRNPAPIAAKREFNPVHVEMLATARLISTRCLVPECDGIDYTDRSSREALGDRYYTAAPSAGPLPVRELVGTVSLSERSRN